MKHIILPTIGFLVAPPLGVLIWLAIEFGIDSIFSDHTLTLVVISVIIGLILGLPIYLFLNHKKLLNLLSILISGSFIAMLPWVLLLSYGNTTERIVGQTVIIENGSYTREGIIYELKFITQFGFYGAISGLVFWLIVRSLIMSKRINNEYDL